MPVEVENKTQTKQYIEFVLGDENFAVPIFIVQEIIEIPVLTYTPNVPDYVKGAMNLRGKVVPIVDFKKRLGIGESIITEESHIIICSVDNRTVGFIVDAISQVFELHDSNISSHSQMLLARDCEKFAIGVSKVSDRLIIVLNIPKIISSSRSQYAIEKEDKK